MYVYCDTDTIGKVKLNIRDSTFAYKLSSKAIPEKPEEEYYWVDEEPTPALGL